MMNFDFTGKTVIITGGMGAIGKATARKYLECGANVVCAGRHENAEVMAWLKEASENVIFVRCDISSWDDCKNLVDETIKHFGKLDILVNNAGINAQLPERKPFHEFDRDFWEKIMDIDVNGTFYLSQLGAQQMIKQGEGGNIVNISSVMGINPARLQCAFTVAKAGVIMMSRVMALELAPYNIRVNCLCPGSIMTEKTYAKFYCDPVKSESLLSHVPMKRAGNADEIADGILYLSSEYSSYTTGNNLVIDGGWQCGFTRDW
ncbi:MAG: SDR family oxidoreductase [Clostridia bacterium]|nr:SDR family oxidoreductase [Clostridia bacterium]